MFYWDYDLFYTKQIAKHEAGEFINRNLKRFPNELPESCFDTLRKPKNIRYISASTENAQARFLPEWVQSTLSTANEEKRERRSPLQRSPAVSRTPLHPARSEERQHHDGFPACTNSGIQLY